MLGDGGRSDEMAAKIKETQANYDQLKKEVRESGINDFVFNTKITVHKKSALLQKTKDDLVESLVECKNAFSADNLWMVLGFHLMVFIATCQAQVEQIQADKVAT